MQQNTSALNVIKTLLELHVWHRMEQIRFIDLCDIALLTAVCYLVIRFILQRRAASVLWGLIVIVISAMVATMLKMQAMMLIFNNIMQVGLIALVIMFQPELRSVLEKIGNASIPNIKYITSENKNKEYISKAINIVTGTACDLAMEKTGALIVIERDTKLGEHMKTGTVLNADISSQLLKNIFFNKAPLHDGAVILRNYRIHSAGCFLPLSFNENIDESLGTRHRAAIGISEVSDAVVVVVSEETGRISIVSNGEIKRNYSYNSLKKELTRILLPNDANKTGKKIKSKNSSKINKEENV